MESRKAKVLIIDDHEATRLLIGASFMKSYHVVTQKDGLAAMAWLSTGNLPDVIILDMQMPRMSGIDLLKQLQSSGFYRHIPVLMVSGNEAEEDVMKCFALGIWGFIQKPFNPISLREKVRQIIQKNEVNTTF